MDDVPVQLYWALCDQDGHILCPAAPAVCAHHVQCEDRSHP